MTVIIHLLLIYILASNAATSDNRSNYDDQERRFTQPQTTREWIKPKNVKCLKDGFERPNFLNVVHNERQKAVVNAFKHAWSGYKKYAWGKDELKPESQSYDNGYQAGLTIVDGLDTAIIMGLKQETEEGIEWIHKNLTFVNNVHSVSVFETTIRVLGGLLSSYHLTGDKIILEKARDLGDRLLKAFHPEKSPYFPSVDVRLEGEKSIHGSYQYSLSEITSLQLEFRDLSYSTGNATFDDYAFNISINIHNIGCPEFEGLCSLLLTDKGNFKKDTITMGARADSYYEYLLKQWIQTKQTIDWLRDDFLQAMSATKKYLIRKTRPNNYWIVGEIRDGNSYYGKMDHLACFLSGTLALSHANNLDPEHLEMAEEIGKTCYEMYNNPTGLGPEIIHGNGKDMFDQSPIDIFVKPRDSHSLLRPEAVEAWFYLYRMTGDKKYQEWGWKVFQSIEKYAKVESGGYSSIQNVLVNKPVKTDKMESFFLAETLKYLFLLLSDDQSILPLDEWVFNTEAHPLPIHC